ncbi:hypothetical protein BAUCODRAFT_50297, partial [Baudoinia panamericana UAMH 10762]
YPVRTYATRDDITSPETNFLQWNSRCDDGLLYFVTPRGWSLPYPGPMILDSHGELVWTHHFDNGFGGQAYDFKVQRYQDEEYLTFWLGDDRVRGHGAGYYYMLNSSYAVVHRVGAANGLAADLHEFLITPDGTALMTMYEVVERDVTTLRSFDSNEPNDVDPNGVWDCIFQEIAIDSGRLIFEWRASDYLEINETYHNIESAGTLSDPFDWFHINSIDKDELGNYLISVRYTHSILYIDGVTGDIIWSLGGKSNDFMDVSDGFAINFAWQHDARFHDINTFPNLYTPPPARAGYTTQLLTVASINGTDSDYTVRVIQSYDNPKAVRSSSQGSMQILPQAGDDPKVLVGYGLNAVWTEFEADGTVLCDVHFGAETSWERGDVQSYRVHKFSWKGYPSTHPVAEISDDDEEIYVSWNGATEVVDWILQCSESDTNDELAWEDVVRVRKEGFETVIPISVDIAQSRFLRIIAIGRGERRITHGVSETIDHRVVSD